MTSETVPYAVPREPGGARAIVLAVLVHAVLFSLLWVGISWVSQAPQSMDPDFIVTPSQVDNPPPEPEPQPQPQPTPPPPVEKAQPEENPEIQQEQERKKREQEAKAEEEQRKKLEEKKKADDEKRKQDQEAADKKREEDKQKLADKKKKDAEDAKFKKLLADDAARMKSGGAPVNGPSTPGKVDGKGDAAWASRVTAKVHSLIPLSAVPVNPSPDAAAEFEVRLLPDGSIGNIRQTKSSGSPVFDDAARRAIELAAPYPPDNSGQVPKGVIPFTSKPFDQKR